MSTQGDSKVYNIIAFVFADPKKAKAVYDELKSSARDEGYKIIANAAVEVDAQGKAHIHESGHGGWGAAGGAAIGGFLGLIGGPVGLLAWTVAGGVIGGFAGKYGGRAIPTKDLERLAAQMQPNTSAILALVEDRAAEQLIGRMSPYQAQVVTLTVGNEASGEITQAVAVEVQGPAPGDSPTEPSLSG